VTLATTATATIIIIIIIILPSPSQGYISCVPEGAAVHSEATGTSNLAAAQLFLTYAISEEHVSRLQQKRHLF
jgi:hypothetical protein